jgi:hypothetical protein
MAFAEAQVTRKASLIVSCVSLNATTVYNRKGHSTTQRNKSTEITQTAQIHNQDANIRVSYRSRPVTFVIKWCIEAVCQSLKITDWELKMDCSFPNLRTCFATNMQYHFPMLRHPPSALLLPQTVQEANRQIWKCVSHSYQRLWSFELNILYATPYDASLVTSNVWVQNHWGFGVMVWVPWSNDLESYTGK